MNNANNFRWTNKSVLALAGGEDPIIAIERKARELVLHATQFRSWKSRAVSASSNTDMPPAGA